MYTNQLQRYIIFWTKKWVSMNLKYQIGQQDSGIGGSLLISFLSNNNLTAIHGQKYTCGSFEKQVGYYEVGGAQNFAKKSPYQSAYLTTAVLTTDRKHSNPPLDSTTAPFDIILPTSTIYQWTWQLSHPPITVLSTQSWLRTLRQPILSSSPSQLVVLFI